MKIDFIKKITKVSPKHFANGRANGGHKGLSNREYALFIGRLKNARIFYNPEQVRKAEFKDLNYNFNLPADLPFKTIVYNSSSKIPLDEMIKMEKPVDLYTHTVLIHTDDYINYQAYIHAISLNEIEPGIFSEGELIFSTGFNYQDCVWENTLIRYITDIIKRSRKGAVKNESCVTRKGITPKDPINTNKIVYLSPSNKAMSLGKNENVDWQHSWEVSGHWRKVRNFGKDPSGNLIKNGFTWIRSHIKGDGELVIKIRQRPYDKN